ncbi:11 kDa late embryogenesis abundant protein-like [Solanum stenotomum]|uniref:11 kDa late embryogenesis abundant protein-like n=1 Tax=Solanum stenotomum TaxID=172797 RepID=UPI0020D1B780|nr:11 kDa late embryogenesis abundant protein-like [Solanum stenotomum]
MQRAKEKAANAAASAKSVMEKTNAIVEEKVERMRTKDIDKKTAAQLNKKEAKDQNANARHGGAQGYTTTGEPEYSTTAYDPTNDTIGGGGGGGGPALFDHPTVKTQDPSFPC